MSQKPLILMITGAWHLPFVYEPLGDSLRALGYEWVCPELATMGADKQGVTWEADVALIHSIVVPLFDAGREVVIIAHSYGGIPSCISTKGLSVKERAAEGKKGGFQAFIYLAAFALPEKGKDLLQTFGGSWAPWMAPGIPYTKNKLIKANELAKEAFFNDLPPEDAQKYFDTLVPHSQDAMETAADYVAGDLTLPKAYIICELDMALPAKVQEHLVTVTPGFRVERLHAGHSPFLSMPDKCAKLIAKIVEEF